VATLATLAALAALADTSLACAESVFAPTRVDSAAGAATTIVHWQIQSSAKAPQSGAEVSATGFSTRGWYPVSGRATVMAGLLENGTYENVFYGDNLRAIEEPDSSGNVFVIPWWYRTEFTVAKGADGIRTLLRINGIIASADVWLNGQLVAERAGVAGAYPIHELDVTRWVHAGSNNLALRVYPGDPRTSLSI
jgi:exo-1,4-beta-D-glucosaminidase